MYNHTVQKKLLCICSNLRTAASFRCIYRVANRLVHYYIYEGCSESSEPSCSNIVSLTNLLRGQSVKCFTTL